jgi:hypothetical protein
MSLSLRDIYENIKVQSNEDISSENEKENYSSLNNIKAILNKLDEERSDTNVVCNSHESFSINEGRLSLGKINNKVSIIKPLSCIEVIHKDCTCENLAGCNCDTRTLTCNAVNYSESSSICSSRTAYYCSCDGRTGSGAYYYSYCTCNAASYTYYYVCQCVSQTVAVYVKVCSCNSDNSYGYYCSCNGEKKATYGYYCSCNTLTRDCDCNSLSYYSYSCGCNQAASYPDYCACASVGYSTYSSGTYYYYYTDYSISLTCSGNCDCVSRTTYHSCTCNSRSEALCSSRQGCSCNQVCECDSLDKEFG